MFTGGLVIPVRLYFTILLYMFYCVLDSLKRIFDCIGYPFIIRKKGTVIFYLRP